MSAELHWEIDDKGRADTVAARRRTKGGGASTGGARGSSAQTAWKQAQTVRFPQRFRKLPIMGLVLISFFYLFDISYPWPNYVILRPRDFLLVRGLWDLFYVVMLATSYTRPLDGKWQAARDYTLVLVTTAFLSILCAHTGRLASPYNIGLMLLVLARCTVLPGSLDRAVRVCAAMLVTWLVVTCFWPAPTPSPGIRGAEGLLTVSYVVASVGLSLIGTFLADRLALGLEAAKIMGRYRLVRRLGAGGMGEVYLAHHASLRRPCAVKILKQELCTPDAVTRFEREAEAASRLRHPNTIAVFDFGRTDEGQPYYVMEYLEGCDLRELVQSSGPLVPERAEYLLAQAASSLAEAHMQSMVHRDIQPGNLFVTATAGHGDFVKVLDFGLVKGADLGPELTRGDQFMGTPRYMAPEALTAKQVDCRADVFSLGAVGYYLLCGTAIFSSDDTYADMYRQIHDEPPPILERRGPSLPAPSAELIEVIARCLAKSPADRYANAGEMLDALIDTPEHGHWHAPAVRTTESGAIRLPGARPIGTALAATTIGARRAR